MKEETIFVWYLLYFLENSGFLFAILCLAFYGPCIIRGRNSTKILIQEADPSSWPVVITIFKRGVCFIRLSVLHFSTSFKSKQILCKILVIGTGGTVGLAEGIIDDTYFLHRQASYMTTIHKGPFSSSPLARKILR